MMGGAQFNNYQEASEARNGWYLVESKIHLDACTNEKKGEYLNVTSRE
jgi:hypothetical protein